MPAIQFDYTIGSAAIDIFILLTISVGVIAEMHRNRPPHQRTTDKHWRLRDRPQTLTIDDRTWREPAGVNVINYGVKPPARARAPGARQPSPMRSRAASAT